MSLIKNVGDPLPSIYTIELYPVIVTLLLQSDDSAILQNGQDVLCSLVNRDFDGILRSSNHNVGGLDLLLQFIAKMLQPETNESSAMFVGKLVRKLIIKGGNHIVPIIPELLLCVVRRLEIAKMPSFIETLIPIFCSLIENQCQTVIDFLHGIKLSNGTTGLELVLNRWCESFADFQGANEVKLTTMSLILVLQTNDPRLLEISVKGDEIENQGPKSIVS